MKTKLFIDFDGTLYDTTKQKEAFLELLKDFDVSREDFLSAYRDECKNNYFTVKGVLRRVHNVDEEILDEIELKERELHDLDSEYVYDDVIPFLKSIDREKYEMNLITVGNVDFQSYKVEKSGLKEYFNNVYCIDCEKWEYLNCLVDKNEKFILVDDREDTIFFIQHKFPNSRAFCITRDDRDTDDQALQKKYDGIRVIKRLNEVVL